MAACSVTVRAEGPPPQGVQLRLRRQDAEMTRHLLAALCSITLVASIANAQARPDFSGAWGPYRGGRGADPKLAAVPAPAPVLKEPYAKAYAERRAADAAA